MTAIIAQYLMAAELLKKTQVIQLIASEIDSSSGGWATLIVIVLILAFILIVITKNIRVVPQAHAYVIERLGTYLATWQTGIHAKLPFIDNIVQKVSLKEQVADFAPQAVITKDNVTMQIDTVVFFQIIDPKLYTYGIENPIMAIENLSATTLRNIIGDLELDETLTSRDVINTNMRQILDIATDPWGIKVNRVELKNIIPPREIQQAMERQMKAEREKREKILRSEGEKESQIRVAEGEKEAAILRAEARKETAIREAFSLILRAPARQPTQGDAIHRCASRGVPQDDKTLLPYASQAARDLPPY